MTIQIAIIGGLGGVTTLYQIVEMLKKERLDLDIEINVLEKTDNVGPGLAYSTMEDAHILNLPAGAMSAIPGQSDHFIKWVSTNNKCYREFPNLVEVLPETFVPRRLFGIYLNDLAQYTKADAEEHNIGVYFWREEVVDIEKSATGHSLNESGKIFTPHQVFLCTGHNPADDHQELFGTPGYYPLPYEITWVAEESNRTAITRSSTTSKDIFERILSDLLPELQSRGNNSQQPISLIAEFLSDTSFFLGDKPVIVTGIGPTAIDFILALLAHGYKVDLHFPQWTATNCIRSF